MKRDANLINSFNYGKCDDALKLVILKPISGIYIWNIIGVTFMSTSYETALSSMPQDLTDK